MIGEMQITIRAKTEEFEAAYWRLKIKLAKFAARYYREKYFRKWTESRTAND